MINTINSHIYIYFIYIVIYIFHSKFVHSYVYSYVQLACYYFYICFDFTLEVPRLKTFFIILSGKLTVSYVHVTLDTFRLKRIVDDISLSIYRNLREIILLLKFATLCFRCVIIYCIIFIL